MRSRLLGQDETSTKVIVLIPAQVSLALHPPHDDARRDLELGSKVNDLASRLDLLETFSFVGRDQQVCGESVGLYLELSSGCRNRAGAGGRRPTDPSGSRAHLDGPPGRVPGGSSLGGRGQLEYGGGPPCTARSWSSRRKSARVASRVRVVGSCMTVARPCCGSGRWRPSRRASRYQPM